MRYESEVNRQRWLRMVEWLQNYQNTGDDNSTIVLMSARCAKFLYQSIMIDIPDDF